MNRNMRLALIAALVVGAGYFAFRWWQNRNASPSAGSVSNLTTSGGLTLGTNLNSKAPNLVGGTSAAGPNVGPAVELPVNVTMNSTVQSAEKPSGANPFQGMGGDFQPTKALPTTAPVNNPLQNGPDANSPTPVGVMPEGGASGVDTGDQASIDVSQ